MDQEQSNSNAAFKRRRHRRVDTNSYHCAVCGDKTSCYNFGAVACEGCKAFFRRHMSRMETMVCTKGGNCDVSKNTRKHCSACRMQKCVSAGMRRDPLTKDFVPKKRKRKMVTPETAAANDSSEAGVQSGSLAPVATVPSSCTSSALLSSTDNTAIDSVRTCASWYSAINSPNLPPKKRNFTPNITPSAALNASVDAVTTAAVTQGDNSLPTVSNCWVNLNSVSTWFPMSTGGTFGSSSTPHALTAGGVQQVLEASDNYLLSDTAFEDIKQNCATFASSQCAVWKRSELDDKLFDEPSTPDARFQLRFMEVRIMRAIQTLKRSRCFATLNDDEKVALLKASLFSAMTTFWGFHAQTRLSANMLIDNFEDGRMVVRDQRLLVTALGQAGVDVLVVTNRMFAFNDTLKRAFPSDWPVILSAMCILTIFPHTSASSRLNEFDWPPFGTSASAFLNAAFEQKVTAVHREHAAFLRRFVRIVCDRDAQSAAGSFFGNADSAVRCEAAWQFCEERARELIDIGKSIQDCATTYFSRKLELSTQITPIIHEVQRTSQRAFTAT